jgi:alpha-tubulin suppressor-like RCC1 family protein
MTLRPAENPPRAEKAPGQIGSHLSHLKKKAGYLAAPLFLGTLLPALAWGGYYNLGAFWQSGGSATATPAVVVGLEGACVLSMAGNVYCWGNNSNGEVGNNSATPTDVPFQVLGVGGTGYLSSIKGISMEAQGTTACALSNSGTVYCWGNGNNGQLGNNTATFSNVPVSPVGVGGSGTLPAISMVAAGQQTTCALSTAGNVYCWGYGGNGQLGNNTTTSQLNYPVQVAGVGGSGVLSGIKAIGAGAGDLCALSTAGNVYCWGYNGRGQLGNNTTTSSASPIEVLGVGGSGFLSNISSIAVGGNQDTNCALSSAGNAYCWGYGYYGAIGNNTRNVSNALPAEVLGTSGSGNLSSITALAVGGLFTCAISGSAINCWGNNSSGQLGNNSTTLSAIPITVQGLSGASAIGAGNGSACAIAGGSVYCWGDNSEDELGINSTSTTQSLIPVQVVGVGGSSNLELYNSGIAAQLAFTTQPSSTGTVGTALSTSPSVTIQDINGIAISTATGSVTLNAYSNSTCTALAAGTLSVSTNPVTTSGGVAAFSAVSDTHAGTIYLGASATGLKPACSSAVTLSVGPAAQLAFTTQPASTGTASIVLSTQPSVSVEDTYGNLISSATNSITLGAYTNNTCTASAGGTFTATTNPVPASSGVAAFTGVSDTTVGTLYLGAVASGLTTGCSNAVVMTQGQLAFTTQPTSTGYAGIQLAAQPKVSVETSGGVVITNSTNAVTLAAYTNSTCTTAAGGTFSAATNPVSPSSGVATFFQARSTATGTIYLGASATYFTSACSSAISLAAVPTMTAVSNGQGHVCSLSSAGNVFCWGDNAGGDLGTNAGTQNGLPGEVLGVGGSGFLSGITAISAGYEESCAVSSGGNVYCWGYNNTGQLGVNSTTNYSVPVEVVGVGGSGFLSSIVSVSTGGINSNWSGASTCAVSSAGNAYCWGLNSAGQLGNNSTTNSLVPVEVQGVGGSGFLSGLSSTIAVGAYSACAATSSAGNVYCWGYNYYGALGNNTTTNSSVPVEVEGVGGSGFLSTVKNVSMGWYQTCSMTTAGTAYCWGFDDWGILGNNTSVQEFNVPVQVLNTNGSAGLTGVTSISTSIGDFSCAIASGNAYCFGLNELGVIGVNNTAESQYLVPTQVDGVGGTGTLSGLASGPAAISTSIYNACAVSAAGGVYCWGQGSSGQLGNGTVSTVYAPVQVLF